MIFFGKLLYLRLFVFFSLNQVLLRQPVGVFEVGSCFMAEIPMLYSFEPYGLVNRVDANLVTLVNKPFQLFNLTALLTLLCLKVYFYFRLTELHLENQIYQSLQG
jgi:hypothetical protein